MAYATLNLVIGHIYCYISFPFLLNVNGVLKKL